MKNIDFDLPTAEEAEALAEGLAANDVDRIIDEKGVWHFLRLLNKNSFMQIYYAMTDCEPWREEGE